MSTSSADPTMLRRIAAEQQRDADALLLEVAALDEAEHRFALSCGDRPTNAFAPVPVTDQIRVAARRIVALADDTDQVSRAFLAADQSRHPQGTITVDDRALARAIRGEDPTRSLFRRLRTMTPGNRFTVLSQLDDRTLITLMTRHPAWMGNTHGVPWRMRARANHVLVVSEIGKSGTDPGMLAVLQRLAGSQVLVFEPGAQRVAVLHGDLDTASDVAVFVPGMGSTFRQFCHGGASTDDKAVALLGEARAQAPGRRPVVIAWLGYNAPCSPREVVTSQAATHGGSLLHRFVDGLHLPNGTRRVLVGHSYGSLTAAQALLQGLHVDAFVAAGSPGLGVDHAESFRPVVAEDVSVLAAPGDPVVLLGAFGVPPRDPAFHGRRVRVNAPDRPRVRGHAHYFLPGSESIRNMAAVVVGGTVSLQPPSTTDEIVSGTNWAVSHLDPNADVITDLLADYDGPGGEIAHASATAMSFAGRVPGGAVRGAIDGIDELLG